MSVSTLISKEYHTLAEAAEKLGVCLASVSRYVSNGQLPAERLGYQLFIRKSDLRKFRRPPMGNPKTNGSGHA